MQCDADDDRDRDEVRDQGGEHVRPEHARPRDRHGLEAFEDAALQVEEQPVRGVRDAGRDRDEQDAGEHVVDVRLVGSGVDRAAEHVHEQQHQRDRGDRGGDDRVGAAEDVAQRAAGQDAGVAEDVGGHRGSFRAGTVPLRCGRRAAVVGLAGVADEGEEDVLEGGLLLDVFDLGGREQLLEFGEGAVLDDRALVQDRDAVGELLGLVEVLGGEQHGRAALGELLDGLPHLDPRLGVEAGGGFVEEDDRRVADQAHRDVEPASHAARVRRCLAVRLRR